MSKISSKPNHGEQLTDKLGVASDLFQVFLDDLQQRLNSNLLGASIIMPVYTVATVPAASSNTNGAIIVSDETGGRTIATSDGTNWRRVSDGAIVS